MLGRSPSLPPSQVEIVSAFPYAIHLYGEVSHIVEPEFWNLCLVPAKLIGNCNKSFAKEIYMYLVERGKKKNAWRKKTPAKLTMRE